MIEEIIRLSKEFDDNKLDELLDSCDQDFATDGRGEDLPGFEDGWNFALNSLRCALESSMEEVVYNNDCSSMD